MPVSGFDHVAITVSDVERTIAFYRDVIGAKVFWEQAWREGRVPVVGLRLGAHVINVHQATAPGSPAARQPTPDSADLCFRWNGLIDQAIAFLVSIR